MLNRILVPLDGSPLAECALHYAEALARRTRARLILVRAVPTRAFPGTDATATHGEAVGDAEAYLESLRRDLSARGIDVETATPYGEAAEWIVEEASSHNADLIVMTTHGRSGIRRWVYGRTAERVIECSPVPVLPLRAWQPEAEAVPPQPARLLVPLDGSPFSEEALPTAAVLARALEAELLLLRVVPASAPSGPVRGEDGVSRAGEEELKRLGAEAQGYLRDHADRLRGEGYRVSTELVIGDPPREISGAEGTHRASMVVMATHGRSGATRLLLGSVATSVLRRGAAPLLLVRPRPGDGAAAPPVPGSITGDTRIGAIEGTLSILPVVVRLDDSLRHVAETVEQHPATRVVSVVGPGGLLAGLLPLPSLRDALARTVLTAREPAAVLETRTAGEAMLPPASVRPYDTIRDALERLERAGRDGLPVTDGADRVVGYVDELELLLVWARGGRAEPSARAREGLESLTRHPA